MGGPFQNTERGLVTAHASQRDGLGLQRLCQEGLFVSLFEFRNRRKCNLLGIDIALLGDEHPRARFINLSTSANVPQFYEWVPGTPQKLQCLVITPELEKNDSHVVLDSSEIALVIHLLKVDTCSGVLN